MTTKTIKGVDDETWTEFRAMAVKSKMKTGELFKRMVELHKREQDAAWDKILNHKSFLSDKEAEEMLRIVRASRREYGFRT